MMTMTKGLILLPALLLGSMAVSAADLKVRIFDRNASGPMSNASVCLGTAANVSQFGSVQTNNNGYAVFSGFPRAPLLVTVSRTGYKSEQQAIVTGNTDRFLMLSLSRGGGGVSCVPDRGRISSGSSSLAVRSFQLAGGDGVSGSEVTLDNSVAGQPTHYRASESSDFSGSEWKVWSKSPVFFLSSGAGEKTVYFQVRRHSTVNGADIETRSPVVRDSITRN